MVSHGPCMGTRGILTRVGNFQYFEANLKLFLPSQNFQIMRILTVSEKLWQNFQ